MSLDEIVISEAILRTYADKLQHCLDLDVALVGAGPAGMTAAWKLGEAGLHVALFERRLSLGGGMWGGGMGRSVIVVQDDSRPILEAAGVPLATYKPGYHTADAVAATASLAAKAATNGAHVFNGVSVEDVAVRQSDAETRVTGLVINTSAIEAAGRHVDPLVVRARAVADCTGHQQEVLRCLTRKNDVRLNTPSGGIEGERSMWAEVAERDTVAQTGEIFPGLSVAGLAANGAYGSYRMGPIFGGMLLSGQVLAEQLIAHLGR